MASKIRDRILTHATRCFAAHGYSGSSTKEIAARADVTEGSLFRLYQSKDKLFTEALTQVLKRKAISRTHLRLVAFAVLEYKGMTDENVKALRRFSASYPLIRAFRSICK